NILMSIDIIYFLINWLRFDLPLSLRWPGRAGMDYNDVDHGDNLKMLIEVKFPGDKLSDGQEEDYTLIATDKRFGVLRVEDNRSDK
ncbi:VRR-NUC domain-containing protein, partial [Thorsellia kenyensis]